MEQQHDKHGSRAVIMQERGLGVQFTVIMLRGMMEAVVFTWMRKARRL